MKRRLNYEAEEQDTYDTSWQGEASPVFGGSQGAAAPAASTGKSMTNSQKLDFLVQKMSVIETLMSKIEEIERRLDALENRPD